MEENYRRSLYSELDDLDYGIVRALQENARLPFTQISKDLGITEKTVRMRVQQLQDDGILSLVGIVNPIKAGIKVQTLIQIAVEEQKLNDVVEQFQNIYEVRLVILTSGDYQLMIQVLTRDYDELTNFIMTKLNSISGIKKTNVIMELKVLKSRFKFIR